MHKSEIARFNKYEMCIYYLLYMYLCVNKVIVIPVAIMNTYLKGIRAKLN